MPPPDLARIPQTFVVVDQTGAPITSITPGAANVAASQAAATTSAGAAAQLVPARTGRVAVTITMITGTADIWIGPTGVTNASGALLIGTKGASYTIPTSAAIFGVSATTTPQTVSILETY